MRIQAGHVNRKLEIRYLTAEELPASPPRGSQRVQARERGTVGAVQAWALLDTLLSS